ncbi:MAG: TetR/AcrR family transcriptional regulator [Candidatus Hydrogenedentota bacterium]|nr:MAG: TetR/AcrR family transcriptional regulator [Candidatus Hydrogenedentota bacterium]
MENALSKREQSKEEKRKKILQAARKVFIEKGYHSTSISDIIRQTDLARGTFYLYFRDKQEIFDELVNELFQAITRHVNMLDLDKLESEQDLYHNLEITVQHLFDTLMKHREIAHIVLSTPFGTDSDFDKKIEAHHEMLFQVATVIFRKAVEKGILNADPVLLSHLVLGGMKEIVFQWIVKGRYEGDMKKEVREIVRIYMKGAQNR